MALGTIDDITTEFDNWTDEQIAAYGKYLTKAMKSYNRRNDRVSRSKYQKVHAENKRLLADIKVLIAPTNEKTAFKQIGIINKWKKYFQENEKDNG